MQRVQLVAIALAVFLVGVTTAYFVVPSLLNKPIASPCSGGVYGAKTTQNGVDSSGQPLYTLYYTKDGNRVTGLYYGSSSGALSWVENKTSSNSVIMGWWDYGKEIIGCTGRLSVISNPSAQFIALGFTQNVTQRDPEQSLTEVGTALFTTNVSLSHSIAVKYHASYLFVTTEDGGDKAPYVLQYLGLRSTDYLTTGGTTFNGAAWTSLGQQTVIFKLLDGKSVPGFAQVYSDSYVKVFSVS